MSPTVPDSDRVADFFPNVFLEEQKFVAASRLKRKVPTEDLQHDLVGLAFSGGGIRSATFNLGVLQALAKLKILHYVNYLSTVSGGGYIGGWLAAMIHRLGGIEVVEKGLDPDNVKENGLPQKAVAYLRTYSNFLTPKVSALSADTWSMFTIWSRNTLLNLVTLVSGVAALILLGRLLGLQSMVATRRAPGTGWPVAAFLVAAVTLALTLRGWWPLSRRRDDKWVQLLVLPPAFLGAFLMTLQVYAEPLEKWLWWGIVLSLLFLVLQALAGFWSEVWRLHQGWRAWVLVAVLPPAAAAISGFVTAWLFCAVSWGVHYFGTCPAAPWLVFTLGPPAMLAAITLGIIVNVGLMGRELPDDTREWLGRLGAWAMVYGAAWLLFFGLAFLGPLGLKAAWSAFAAWAKATVTVAWVATTIGGLLAAKSSKTGGEQGGGTMNLVALAGPWVFVLGFVSLIGLGVHELTVVRVPSTPPAAASCTGTAKWAQAGSAVTVTFDCQGGPKKAEGSPSDQYWGEMKKQVWSSWARNREYGPNGVSWYKGLSEVLGLALLITLVMSWRVDVNEFSLHHFYKNRLVRCYLGASRKPRGTPPNPLKDERNPNPFTGFDPDDDFPLNHLDDGQFSGPFPIVNATLNVSGGRNLAWQERKGASFIFTPVYCGYDAGRDASREDVSGTAASRGLRLGEVPDGDPPRKGYLRTHLVAKTKYRPEPARAPTAPLPESDGILLGTTVAISGAAANPNQGYHTSTAVAFLMTVFNVRLGWWLGNPARERTASMSGPAFGLGYTLAELFGTTTSDSAFVNLSDGGHFDNMGLYELVRRKCRYIVVCDAEQDEGLAFGGLATAIRMCRTDFGAEIDIHLDRIARKPDNKLESFSGCHYAVGKIAYKDAPPGKLVYLKASLTGDEPADVLGFHKKVPMFPHESTADQWFKESQFESYRALGYHVADMALGHGRPLLHDSTKRRFFGDLTGCAEPS